MNTTRGEQSPTPTETNGTMRFAMSSIRPALVVLVTMWFGAVAAPASAQEWLADRKRAEGPGIRIGDFELHPGIGVEVGYDSNVFLSDGEGGFPITDSAILRVTPHLLFSSLGAQRREEGEAREGDGERRPALEFRGGLSASYYSFFAVEARNNLAADADLNLIILPERPFTIALHERFGRTVRPFTEQTGSGVGDGRVMWGRNENDAGIELSFGTPGRILSGRVGYSLIYQFFDGDQFAFGNFLEHRFTAGAAFRFLPRTAFVYDLDGRYRTYNGGATASTLVADGFILRNRVGVNGALSQRFSFTLMVGHAAGWFASRDDVDAFVAQGELRWQVVPNLRLGLGYDRDVRASFIGNYVRTDRGYLNAQLLLGGSFLLGADASVAAVGFGIPVGPDGMTPIGGRNGDVREPERSDLRLVFGLFGEYRLTNWLGLNATLRYTSAITDYRYLVDSGMPGMPIIDPAAFAKFEGWLGVRAFY